MVVLHYEYFAQLKIKTGGQDLGLGTIKQKRLCRRKDRATGSAIMAVLAKAVGPLMAGH